MFTDEILSAESAEKAKGGNPTQVKMLELDDP